MAAGGKRGIRAGRAFVELGVHDKTVTGLRRAQRRLKAFGAGVTRIGASLAKFGLVAGAALFAAARSFARMGDSIAKMAKRTGMSVQALSELRYVASQTGTSMTALEMGLRRMQRTLYDADRGLSTAVDGLADLGLTAKQLRGLAPERQFQMMADAIQAIEDPSRRAALAMVMFGRSGTALLPMMADGAAGIERLQQKARDLGITISQEDSEAAEKFTDDLDTLWKVVQVGIFHIGASLVPLLTDLAKTIQDNVARVTAWVRTNGQLIVSIAKTTLKIAAVGVALLALGKIIGAVSVLFGIASLAVKGLTAALTVLAKHPVIAVLMVAAAAIAGLLYLIRRFTGDKRPQPGGGAGKKAELQAKKAAAEAKRAAAEAFRARQRERADVERTLDLEKKLAAIRKRQADQGLTHAQRRIKRVRDELAEHQKLIQQLLEVEQLRKGGPRAARTGQLRKERGAAEKHALEEIMRIQNAEDERRARESYRRLEQLHRDLVNIKMESTGVDRRTASWAVKYEQFLKKREALEKQLGKEEAERRRPMKKWAEYVRIASEGLYQVTRGKVLEKVIGVRGTFYATAIGRALAGGTAAEVTAKNTAETKKNTARLVKLAEKGKLIFTD